MTCLLVAEAGGGLVMKRFKPIGVAPCFVLSLVFLACAQVAGAQETNKVGDLKIKILDLVFRVDDLIRNSPSGALLP